MKPTTKTLEPAIHSAAISLPGDRMATGSLVDEFDARSEIERVNAIFTEARALVGAVLRSRDRSARRRP